MIHVEAVELAVAHEIDAGLLLRMDDDARRVDHRLLGRQRAEPVRERIGADDGRLDDARLRVIRRSLPPLFSVVVDGRLVIDAAYAPCQIREAGCP